MKPSLFTIFILLLFTACSKEVDDTDKPCTQDCTVILGRILTTNGAPVKDVPMELQYKKRYYKRRIGKARTDANGNYRLSFHAEDEEIALGESGYFEWYADGNSLDKNQYLVLDKIYFEHTFSLPEIRDTVIEKDLFIPRKTKLKVYLNGFNTSSGGDVFSVSIFYAYGWNKDNNAVDDFTGDRFGSGQSATISATPGSSTFTANLEVSRNDTNIVRLYKFKNGVRQAEDIRVFIADVETYELTYNY